MQSRVGPPGRADLIRDPRYALISFLQAGRRQFGVLGGARVSLRILPGESRSISHLMSTIVTEKGLLEALPVLSRRQLARLRRQKKLPYLKISNRSFLYDTERVTEALRQLEVYGKGTTATAK